MNHDPGPTHPAAWDRVVGPVLVREACEPERAIVERLPGLSAGRETCRCAGHLVAHAHRAGPGWAAHKWFYPVNQCDKSNCVNPICVARHGRKRADRVRAQFQHLAECVAEQLDKRRAKLRILGCVLTIPDTCLPQDRRRLQALRVAGRQVLTDWILAVNNLYPGRRRDPGWRIGGVDVYHPSNDPTWVCRECGAVHHKRRRTCAECESPVEEIQSTGWRPHLHVEIPAYAWHEPSGEWAGLRCEVERWHLDLLRDLWGAELVRVLGWVPKNLDFAKCSVHYRWLSHAEKLAHRVRYDMRHFPAWHGHWRSIRWWGYLAPRWRSRIGIETPDETSDDELQHDVTLCPCCGRSSDLMHSIYVGEDSTAPLEWARAPPWLLGAVTVYS